MITGYLIVRKVDAVEVHENNFLKPYNNTIYYHGIDRLMWGDIDNYLFKGGTLDNNALNEYKSIVDSGNDGSFLNLANTLNSAEVLLNHNNAVALNNEIIAIESSFLNVIKPKIQETPPIYWMGYDLVLLGGWSLIRHGIFENNMLSLLNNTKLNRYGLFDNPDSISGFLDEYNLLSDNNKVDKIIDSLILDTIKVGKPIIDANL
ncbi:hypothetical protein F0919_03880 [Taibaiella lutea]|uniref:Uncharacterized protein n=1 Tax=Taibaiella lutea TaxID=2608001 RepID=A0A5M6CUF2_9BACT|nr:hypothetical protein [Taibaiella lutea]KAA5536819.1 hypothetical protein F0919_03880 [Taibaiella lutea]